MRARLFLLLLATSAAAPAQQLGTLFHSANEREALDRMRRGESVSQVAAPLPDPVVTGYVKRSDGKSTVFIDKRAYPARDPRMQGAIEPRIIQRYEPYPLPPEATPPLDVKATTVTTGAGKASKASPDTAPTPAVPYLPKRAVED